MARIITKELALKIVKKLGAVPIKSKSKAHDDFLLVIEGIQLAIISIRRASEKDKGHDYLKHDLHIIDRCAVNAKSRRHFVVSLRQLAQCATQCNESFIRCFIAPVGTVCNAMQ